MKSLPGALRKNCASAISAAVLLVCGWHAASAKSPAPEPDLRSLRASFRQSLLNAILPEKRAYLDLLRDFEKKLADAHDYAGAIRARDERLSLEQEITAFEQELPTLAARASGAGQLLPERIVLQPKAATLANLTLDKDGAIIGWGAPQAAATWKLPALPAGGYDVIIRASVGGGEGGSFLVREPYFYLRGTASSTDGKIKETNIGTLKLSSGTDTLTLVADGTVRGGLMRLVSLQLAPASR